MKTKENVWFSHEAYTYTTMPMMAMIDQYGAAGYGYYWILLEVLRDTKDYKFDISRSYAYRALAGYMRTTEDEVKSWVKDCVEEYDLLQTDGNYLWSESLRARMVYMEEKKVRLSERGRRGAAVTNAKRSAQASA